MSGPWTAADRRGIDMLRPGEVTWTGAGTSIRPLHDAAGVVVLWRAYDGVHESWWADRLDAFDASLARRGKR